MCVSAREGGGESPLWVWMCLSRNVIENQGGKLQLSPQEPEVDRDGSRRNGPSTDPKSTKELQKHLHILILQTDKTKTELFTFTLRFAYCYIWCKTNKIIIPTVKHGSAGVMVWGCFRKWMTCRNWWSVSPSVCALKINRTWVTQQENLKHTSKSTFELLRKTKHRLWVA